MGHHHARDGYETVNIPEKFRPLLRRLQRGPWTQEKLEWVLRQHRHVPLPPIIRQVVRAELAELGRGGAS